jgi:hypothetical protein
MRYYFHIKAMDTYIADDEGMEFADAGAALEEAVRAAHEIARETIPEAGAEASVFDFRWIEVADERGESLFTVPIRNVYMH